MREFVEMRYFSGDSVFWEETVEDFASNTVDRSRLGPCIKAGGRCMKIVRFSIQSSVKRNKVLVVSSRGRVQPDQINMAGFFWYLLKSDLSSVRYSKRLHWTLAYYLQGSAETLSHV